MSTHEHSRRVHELVDAIKDGYTPDCVDIDFLRSFLPELPKQKTLEEIAAHVYDAWIRSSGYEWAGNIDNPEVPIEEWLAEIHTQLKGLKDDAEPAKPAHPEFLETEADYENAPEGTVVVQVDALPWAKEDDNIWTCAGGSKGDYSMSLVGSRRVLRWGWGE